MTSTRLQSPDRPKPGRVYFLAAALGWAFQSLLGCGLSEIPTGARPGPRAGQAGSGEPSTTGGTGGGGTGAGSAGPSAGGSGGSAGGSGNTGGGAGSAGTGGPSASGVSIGGQNLRKDQVIVFLHIGHSNMAGRSVNPESERPYFYDSHPRLWAYGDEGLRPAVEPLSADSMTRGRAGPGMAILRSALARAAEDAYVVSIGRGQSGLTGGYCTGFRKDGLLYDFVMGPAMELKGKVIFGGVFVMFGISEVNDEQNAPTFGDCAVAVAREMRADLEEPDLPFVFGDWEDGATSGVGPDSEIGQAIIPQLRMLPQRISRTVLIPTVGLPIEEDDHHYNLVGHREWAERGFNLLVEGGFAPWVTTN